MIAADLTAPCRSLHNTAAACINSLGFFSAMSGDGVKMM